MQKTTLSYEEKLNKILQPYAPILESLIYELSSITTEPIVLDILFSVGKFQISLKDRTEELTN